MHVTRGGWCAFLHVSSRQSTSNMSPPSAGTPWVVRSRNQQLPLWRAAQVQRTEPTSTEQQHTYRVFSQLTRLKESAETCDKQLLPFGTPVPEAECTSVTHPTLNSGIVGTLWMRRWNWLPPPPNSTLLLPLKWSSSNLWLRDPRFIAIPQWRPTAVHSTSRRTSLSSICLLSVSSRFGLPQGEHSKHNREITHFLLTTLLQNTRHTLNYGGRQIFYPRAAVSTFNVCVLVDSISCKHMQTVNVTQYTSA